MSAQNVGELTYTKEGTLTQTEESIKGTNVCHAVGGQETDTHKQTKKTTSYDLVRNNYDHAQMRCFYQPYPRSWFK